MKKTWFEMKAAAGGEKSTEVMIFDEIGLWGVTAKDFATALKAIPDDHAITVRINSPGGSVFDGYAIFNALKSRAANVTTKIEGVAASMASIIALAGSKVTAAANSIVMIHNPCSGACGESEDLRKMADLLDKITGQLVAIYAAKTGLPDAEVRAAMDMETWFTAAEAKEWGLVDEITDEIPATASFDTSRFRNVPKGLAPRLDVSTQANFKQAQDIAALTAERDELRAKLDAAQSNASALDAEKSAHATTQAALASLKEAAAKQAADAFVSEAIASGRLTEDARAKFAEMFIKDEADARSVVNALRPPIGAEPVVAEMPDSSASDDAKIFTEYDSIKDQSARLKFLKAHESSIWRHHTRN